MSSRLLVILLPWLIGLSLGVAQVNDVFLIIMAGLMALGAVFYRLKTQVVTAGVAVLLIGFLWGSVSSAIRPMPFCPPTSKVMGVIAEIVSRQDNTLRLIVADKAGCRFIVSTLGDMPLHRGDEVEFQGKFQPVSKEQVSAGYLAYLERKQIAGSFNFASIIVTKQAQSPFIYLGEKLQAKVNTIFLEPEASLANAMLFNQSGTLPQQVIDNFRATGVTHVLAISGSNITLLVALLVICIWPLKLSAWWRSLLILVLMWLYIFLIDKPVSAVRASYFWSIAILAFRLSRLTSLPGVVLLTVATMASLFPPVLADIGFQLSLGAVVGIGLTLFLFNGLSFGDKTIGIVDVLLSTLGATLATWPLIVFWFGTFSTVSLPANLLVVPAVSFMYSLMVITLLISFVVPTLSLWFTFVVHVLWLWTDVVTNFLAQVPHAFIGNLHISIPVIIMYYVVLLLVATVWLKKQNRSWREMWQ